MAAYRRVHDHACCHLQAGSAPAPTLDYEYGYLYLYLYQVLSIQVNVTEYPTGVRHTYKYDITGLMK